MKFSLLSWNVETFTGTESKLSNVTTHVKSLNPDVVGFFEVENVNIISLMNNQLPEYDYNLTDGPENKEILVGVRRGKFQQSIFTQKREFKAYNPSLRPGALMSLWLAGEFYNILFLHTDSGTEAPSFGNRNEMFDKIWSLKKALDKKSQGGTGAKLIVLGVLNTMGLQYPFKKKTDTRISEADEIKALEAIAEKNQMVVLQKEFNLTYNNGTLMSNLDHVIATDNLTFRQLGTAQGRPFFVRVSGWQQLQGSARKQFIETISHHCSLYSEVA